MVTGRISLRDPEYSPISSAVRLVRLRSSSRHCRALTVFVTRISVVALARAIAAAPTIVFPAPARRADRPGPEKHLAGAAGRKKAARAAVPEPRHSLLLVRAQRPAVLGQVDR